MQTTNNKLVACTYGLYVDVHVSSKQHTYTLYIQYMHRCVHMYLQCIYVCMYIFAHVHTLMYTAKWNFRSIAEVNDAAACMFVFGSHARHTQFTWASCVRHVSVCTEMNTALLHNLLSSLYSFSVSLQTASKSAHSPRSRAAQ